MTLEALVRTSGIASALAEKYAAFYTQHKHMTNYISTALGTIGGNAIAKQFTDHPHISASDVSLTAVAALPYSLIAERTLSLAARLTDRLLPNAEHASPTWRATATAVTIGLYMPINLAYWSAFTIKNGGELNERNLLAGVATIAISSLPYVAADYLAFKHFTKPQTVKYLRPFYSAVSLVWNTLFSGANYFTRK